MKKLIDRLVSWIDMAKETPRLKTAGFHFCQDTGQWMFADRVFSSRHSAMECLRRMEIAEAYRRCAS